MKKKLPRIISFFLILLLYFLPTILFPIDNSFYYSLKGPHLSPWLFILAWTVIYILMSIFTVFYLFNDSSTNHSEIKRIKVFIFINYILNALYTPVFFKAHNLFGGYILSISIFITILIIFLESLLVNKKISLLTLPYVLWSAFASVLSILLYLQN